MRRYRRVSYEVRCQIDAFLQVKLSIPEIARRLGYNKTTIYREIKRNSQFGIYTPGRAQWKASERYRRCRRPYILRDETLKLVVSKLKEGWSPEQISGRFRKEKQISLSHTCIYKFIYRNTNKVQRLDGAKYNKDLAKTLRKHGRRGAGRYLQRRAVKKYGYTIHERSSAANRRIRIGDWERDTMHTANGVQILVMNDRKSRLTKICALESRKNTNVDKVTEDLIRETGRKAFTVTNDNGSDFKASNGLPCKVYFCDPFKPQQRGTVENTIGLLRQYIKRTTDIKEFDLKRLENKLNNRPRKVLDYQTPNEVYFKKKVALASLI